MYYPGHELRHKFCKRVNGKSQLIIPLIILLCFIVGCQDKGAMAKLEAMKAQVEIEEQNKALVKRFIEGLNNRNADIFKELYAPDYVWYFPSNNPKPSSHEEELEFVKFVWVGFPDINWKIEELIAVDDRVITRFIARGTHTEEFQGIPATGNRIETSGIVIHRIKNGKAIEAREESDLLGMMQQLGMELKPTEGSTEVKQPIAFSDGYIHAKDDVNLYYQKIGDGPKIVIIPSGMYLATTFKRVISKERTLIFYDQRNRGRSGALNDHSKLGIEYEISDLEAIRTYFRYKKVTLIGWSYSGAVVALYAIQNPDVVDRVIQIDPIPPRKDLYWTQFQVTLSSRKDSNEQSTLDDIYAEFKESGNLPQYIQRYYAIAHNTQKFDNEIKEVFRSDFYSLKNERPDIVWNITLPTIIESLGNWDFREGLPGLQIPVLTIHGDYDAIPLDSAKEWTQFTPDSRLVIINNCGHFPWYEQPEVFFTAVNQFLDGNWPEGSIDFNVK